VHRRTAGNPFFVSQILDQPDAPLPATVRDAVIARTAGLSPAERHSIELLACAPEGVSSALLGALDLSAETVGALAATGLLDPSGRGVVFRHEIARSAVLGAVALGAEPALHATMITALERIGGDASVLAHHAVAAHDVGRILRYAAEAAGESARAGAHREAVAFYELALPHVTDPAGKAELLEALSVELYLTDRLDHAIAAREQAVALRGDLADTAAVGAGHTAISGLAWYDADLATAVRHKDAAIAILSGTDDARRSASRWPTTPSSRPSRATPPRPVPRAPAHCSSPTAIRCCTASRRSGSPSPASSTATSRRGRTSSRPGTRACANTTTTSPPPR
jgi:hypothetical protein